MNCLPRVNYHCLECCTFSVFLLEDQNVVQQVFHSHSEVRRYRRYEIGILQVYVNSAVQ